MTDSVHDTADTGALSSQGRFKRMEEALERIETKLDAKADSIIVVQLEARVLKLEQRNEIGDAVSAKTEKANDDRYRAILWMVALVTIAGVVFNAALAAFRLFLIV